MGRKRKRKEAKKIFCWYCDREFHDEKVLIEHQKMKHFKCQVCDKRLHTISGLIIHMSQVHREDLRKVPNAIAGRDGTDREVYGMHGVDTGDSEETPPVDPLLANGGSNPGAFPRGMPPMGFPHAPPMGYGPPPGAFAYPYGMPQAMQPPMGYPGPPQAYQQVPPGHAPPMAAAPAMTGSFAPAAMPAPHQQPQLSPRGPSGPPPSGPPPSGPPPHAPPPMAPSTSQGFQGVPASSAPLAPPPAPPGAAQFHGLAYGGQPSPSQSQPPAAPFMLPRPPGPAAHMQQHALQPPHAPPMAPPRPPFMPPGAPSQPMKSAAPPSAGKGRTPQPMPETPSVTLLGGLQFVFGELDISMEEKRAALPQYRRA